MAMTRSENMRRIKGKNTRPELEVRRVVRDIGYTGYRLHRRDVPGCPDIVFLGKRKAIFVHGCFWHGHNCKVGNRSPRSNVGYWSQKIRRNQERDEGALRSLNSLGWSVLVIWECEIKDLESLTERLKLFLHEAYLSHA
jgi:DNA mismatch endonuclease (patch repair protein)